MSFQSLTKFNSALKLHSMNKKSSVDGPDYVISMD